ncbi:tRNA 5-hydroxyuridine modification protein YegQ [Curvibacter sp. CHRR-16]|uniref:prephenate-dependent tRNA uridine(34) hydroxylase TrhP n=1 Tax=Curvibacter sp. CHRR-16 TaxID=2835872 RepID=UPI001BDB2AD3|nr:tRNA 5-hydroxyuridine modification protein YegQ [Curvibacter sp. CHRR-16]MBT0569067.1 tRNA 5-hydroxyuridine modification protein YegQ [Curvibacter sp. CHRR-16]
MTYKTPELLAPAGSLTMLKTALAFGATAVYAGQPRYSLRVRNNSFGDLDVLRQGIEHTHALGKKFYLVSNIYPHSNKVKSYVQNMQPVIDLRPDALIMSDPGLIMMAREAWPDTEVHLSVQANTVNSAAVKFWQRVGITRVILSRELSLDQVAQIRQDCPDMELEVFVHGALCIAYSGRCLLSGYFNHRDPNQGTCTNACRWDYKTHAAQVDASGDVLAPPAAAGHSCGSGNGQSLPQEARDSISYLLEESNRPGEFMPIEEDEHGTYIMNSKDLRAIEHVQRLVEIGVDSLKIEGRTKSPYYVARTAQSYRRAIDDAVNGHGLNPELLGQLEGLANRGYTSGFFQRHTPQETQNYLRGYSESGRSQYVGDVLEFDTTRQLCKVNVRNKFAVGDWLEVIHPAGNHDVQLQRMENADAQPMDVAPGSGHTVWLPLPQSAVGAFLARYLQAREDAAESLATAV